MFKLEKERLEMKKLEKQKLEMIWLEMKIIERKTLEMIDSLKSYQNNFYSIVSFFLKYKLICIRTKQTLCRIPF